ncbi:MAG: porin family protein [Bacteroidota bacterium]
MKGFALLLFAALLLSTTLLKAQILIGPVVGPQVSWVSFDNKDSKALYKQKPMYGFHAGLGVTFRVHKRFFLNTAFLYSTKGKYLDGKEDQLLRYKSRLNYIDIPVVYTVEFLHKVGKVKQYKFFFGIGPNVSYWLGGKGYLENSQLNEILVNHVDYRVTFDKADNDYTNNQMNVNGANRLQLGLNLATGFVFEPLGYQKVMMTVRYELGHSFQSPENNGTFRQTNEFQDDLRVRVQGLRISASYLIDLKNSESKKGKSTINKRKLK